MTLKRKLLTSNLLLVLGLLAIGAALFWRLSDLSDKAQVPRYAYTELRTAEVAATQIAMAKGLLSTPGAKKEEVIERLESATTGLNDFITFKDEYDDDEEARKAYAPMIQTAQTARDRLGTVLNRLKTEAVAGERAELVSALDDAMWDLDAMARMCLGYIRARHESAATRLAGTAVAAGLLSAGAVSAAALVSVLQYRSVMRPLHRLRQGVQNVAKAQFTETIDPATAGGGREFAELADDFNRMARELDGFYRQLEEKVVAKSKELVRSERLASVGFLAAGVAHEINNPLNIISGYAELTARKLRCLDGHDAAAVGEALPEACQSLQIIRDEAFRCKEITDKLLSLAKAGGDGHREPLSLADVAREVAQMTKGLKNYRDRRLTVQFEDTAEPLQVVANVNEMKQVLLNLTVNALEAVKPGEGEVRIEGRRENGWVEVSVADNGRGIPAETLKHVFEPFFTDKRGAIGGERGTGLGLSITHAIVESHGGRLRAESDGPGRGSRFTVQLPARGPVRGKERDRGAHAA